jgi:hypothetical protein
MWAVLAGRETGRVGIQHRVTLGAQRAEGVVEVEGVPQGDAVEDQAERAELVLSEMLLKALGGLRSTGTHAV